MSAQRKPFYMNQLPGVKANTALMNRVKATKTIDQLKDLYKNELSPAQRKQVKEAFIAHSNKLKKAAKGKTGQPSTSTKSTKPAPVQPQGSNQANTGTGRDGGFGTGTYGKGRQSDGNRGTGRDGKPGTGTHGKLRPSDPKPERQRTGRRRRGGVNNPEVSRNLQNMAARARIKAQAARNKNRRLPMGPAKKPYKGHRYKTPFGPIMEYNGTKYVRVR